MWLERYSSPARVTSRGAYQLYSCRDAASGEPRVVVTASPGTEAAMARDHLDEVARVHRLIEAPRVPRVAERGAAGEVEFLAFACDGVRTLEELWKVQAAIAEEKIPLALGLPLADVMSEAVEAVHEIADPETGRPLALGTWSWSNVLVSPAGELWLIGFGQRLANAMAFGQPTIGSGAAQAPELVLGTSPTPAADVFGLTMLIMSLLPYAQVPQGMSDFAAGRLPGSPDVAALLMDIRVRALAIAPEARYATMAERRMAFDRLWALLELEMDPEATRAWLTGLVEIAAERPELGEGPSPAPAPGVTIQGRYRVERRLGEGRTAPSSSRGIASCARRSR